jgi:hypothetical protein
MYRRPPHERISNRDTQDMVLSSHYIFLQQHLHINIRMLRATPTPEAKK